MGIRTNWHRTTTIKQHQNKKIEIFWSHFDEKGRLLGERNNAGHNSGKDQELQGLKI